MFDSFSNLTWEQWLVRLVALANPQCTYCLFHFWPRITGQPSTALHLTKDIYSQSKSVVIQSLIRQPDTTSAAPLEDHHLPIMEWSLPSACPSVLPWSARHGWLPMWDRPTIPTACSAVLPPIQGSRTQHRPQSATLEEKLWGSKEDLLQTIWFVNTIDLDVGGKILKHRPRR